MTVPVQSPVSTHVGNGVTTTFAYGFLLFAAEDLQVIVGGVVKTLNVDYTVTGLNVPGGGSVIFGTAPASLAAISLVRQVALKRDTDYQYSGDFQSATVNRDIDRTVMMIQDSGLAVANAVRFPAGDGASGILPPAAERALKGLAFDASGNPFVTAASGNADVLAAALASAATPTVGGGIVGFDSSKTYGAGTVGKGIKDASAAAAAASSAAGVVAGDLTTFKVDAASLSNVAKGAALIGYKLNMTGSVGRTLAAKLAERVSVMDFGAVGNGVADDTAAINAALAASRVVHMPAGTYKTSGPISLTMNGHSLIGEGRDVVGIVSSAAATPVIVLTAGVASFRVEGMTISKSVTATGGGHGIQCLGSTQSTILRNLEIRSCNIGLALGICDEGTIENVSCRLNTSHGIYCTNSVGYGAAQWRLRQVLCSGSGGDGIRFVTTPGPAGMILGAWDTVETYANSGAGISLLGSPTTPIYDFRLSNGFLGSDSTAGIYMDTYGGKHRIMNTFVERVGRDSTGPTFTTPGTNASNGIHITANNVDMAVLGCVIDECSYNGILHAGGVCVVNGCSIYNNGAAGTSGQRNGVATQGGVMALSGGMSTNLGGATLQAYGFSTTHDAFTVTGMHLGQNVTAPYILGVGITWGGLVGNFNPFAEQHVPGTLRKSGASVYTNP